MRCRDVRRLLVMEEVAGYGGPRRGGVARHLRVCEGCRRSSERLREESSLLGRIFEDLPIRADFLDGVRARLPPADQMPMP